METKTEKIIYALKLAISTVLVIYTLRGGGQIISFALSFIKPEAAKNIYGVDQQVFALQQYSNWYFIWAMLITIVTSVLKVYIAILAIKLLSKLNITTPFSNEMASKIENISYNLMGIWAIAFVGRIYFKALARSTGLTIGLDNAVVEYIFIACIAFLIAQIIRRGINMQEENQLTV